MRTIIIDIEERPRPKLSTPAKGSQGDMTNESMAVLTDLDFIIKRYGGNLAELQAWRGRLNYGDATVVPTDLVDAFNLMKDAHDRFDALDKADNPFASFEEAMAALRDGTFEEKISKFASNKGNQPPVEPIVESKPVEPIKETPKEPLKGE